MAWDRGSNFIIRGALGHIAHPKSHEVLLLQQARLHLVLLLLNLSMEAAA